jgi:hypothetical protein
MTQTKMLILDFLSLRRGVACETAEPGHRHYEPGGAISFIEIEC